jgi:Tfp pilus assembly PilM family ATPase
MSRLIAIDLGRRAVKATLLQGSGRRFSTEGRFSAEVAAATVGPVSWDARFAALDELLRSHPTLTASNSTYAVAWPSDAATVRRLRLPFSDRAKVDRALTFEVEAQVPFDLDEMVLASRVLGGDGYTDILVALARKEAVQSLLDGLSERKIDPKYIFLDIDVLAGVAPREGTHAVLDLGHDHATLAIVRDGALQWSRALSVGGHAFLTAAAARLGGDEREAESALAGEGVLPATWQELPEGVRESLNAPLGLLLTEVRSSLIVAEDSLGVDVAAVHLGGGFARWAPLAALLAQDLGVSVEVLNAGDGRGGAGHLVCDSLAARMSSAEGPFDLNLRSGEFAFRGGADVRMVLTFGGAGLAFFALASLGLFAWRYQQLSEELGQRHARTQELVQQIVPDADPSSAVEGRAVTAVADKVTDAKARAQAFERSDLPPTVDVIARLSEAFPPKGQGTVDVTELTVTPENVSFNAEADGYTSAAAVEEALRKVEAFREATKGNEKKNREKVNFTVTIPLVAKDATAQEG